MKRKKLFLFFALIVCFALIVAGCRPAAVPEEPADPADPVETPVAETPEEETPEEEPAAEELPEIPSEITMFVGTPLAATTPPWDTPIGQKIAELTGVTLNVEYLVGTDIMTRANVMVASGVYPDIVAAGEAAGVFIGGNAFVPLDDMIEKYGENIRRIYRPSELRLSALQHGATYIISTNRPTIDNLYPGAGWYVNFSVLKDAGFPVVRTLSQYGQLIQSYLARNPEFNGAPNIGFMIPTDGFRASNMQFGAARFLGGFPNDGVTAINQETLEATIVMRTPAMKEYLKFMNDMWHSGAMDREVFMQKDDQYQAKVSSGRVLGIYDQRWAIGNAFLAMEQNGHFDRTLVAMPVVGAGVEREFYRGPFAFAVQGVSITTAAKNPEGVFRFLDRMAAEDIQKLNFWGIEGVDYTIENGRFTRTEEQWLNSFNLEYQQTTGLGQFSFLPRYELTNDEEFAKFSDGNWVNPAMNQEFNEMRYREHEKEILRSFNIQTLNDFFAPAYPAFYQPGWAARQQLAQDSIEFIATTKALELTTEYVAKISMADPTEFEQLWLQFQEKLNAIPGLLDYETLITEIIRASAEHYR